MATRLKCTKFIGVYGNEYTIEIDDSAYSGAVTEIETADPGFEITWNKPGSGIVPGVMASTASVYILVESAGLDTFVDDLTGAEEGRFTVKITRKQFGETTKLYWVGYCLSDTSELEDMYYPTTFKLACVDGISRLQTIDYANGVPYGNVPILTHILTALQTGVLSALYYAAGDNYLATSVKWRSTLHGTPANNFCPSAHTRVSGEVFSTKDERTGKYTFLSCLEALTEMCIALRARFYYSDGVYRFEQLGARESGAWPVRYFSKSGTYLSGGAMGDTQFSINNNKFGSKISGIKFEWYSALKSVITTYNHRTYKNWLDGQSWRWGTTALGGPYNISGYGDLSFDADTYLRISGVITYKITGGSNSTPFRHLFFMEVLADTTTLKRNTSVVPNTSIINYDNPEWTGTTNQVQLTTGFIFSGEQEGELAFVIQTPVIPSGTKDITVEFLGGDGEDYDQNGNSVLSPTLEVWGTKNLTVQIINSSTPDNFYDAKEYTVTNTNVGNSDSIELKPVFGRAIQPWTPTKIQVRNGPAGTWTDSEGDWRQEGMTAAYPIEELLTRETLGAQIVPRQRILGQVLGLLADVHATLKIEATNDLYIFQGGTFNPYDETISGEWYFVGYDYDIIEPGGPVDDEATNTGFSQPSVNAIMIPGQQVVGTAVAQSLNADSNIALAAQATNYVNGAIAAGAITSIPLQFPTKANAYLPGDDIMLVNPQTGKITNLVVAAANADGATTLSVTGTLPVAYPGGSYLLYSVLNKFTGNGSDQSQFSLVATTSASTFAMAIPAKKWAVAVALESGTAQTINIGNVSSGNQYGDAVEVLIGQANTVSLFFYSGAAGGSIHFSGITAAVTITVLTL